MSMLLCMLIMEKEKDFFPFLSSRGEKGNMPRARLPVPARLSTLRLTYSRHKSLLEIIHPTLICVTVLAG